MTTASSVEPSGSGEWFSVLRWIKDKAGESLEPYGAITDLDKQEETWNCHGCGGEFLSRWPKWEKPTDATFPHEAECMYLKASRLLASAENVGDMPHLPAQQNVKTGGE
jgi:hypothetical protein